MQNWKTIIETNDEYKAMYEMMSESDKEDAFNNKLSFGTAGMRGLLGVGPNRINEYTIARANIGYGMYLKETFVMPIKVAIAYDNRHFSKRLAITSANVLEDMGIKCYVFESPRPTPELSFAVRELGCQGGIVITASHNPKEYNGYKIYDETGCQLTDEKSKRVMELIETLPDESTIELKDTNTFEWLDETFDTKYKNKLNGITLRNEPKKIKIILTTQHGTAYPVLNDVLTDLGYDVIVVTQQANYDPDFSNTLSPNPEEHDSYSLGIEYAKKYGADIVIATDPDADRMGVVVMEDNTPHYLTGNKTGALLLEYLFNTLQEFNQMPDNPFMVNTIVTSHLGDKIASEYNVENIKTLTGFKYIGSKIEELTGIKNFVFGYEESYGYLIQPFVRDKDALQATILVCELANHHLINNKSLVKALNEIYNKYGYFYDKQVSITKKGNKGQQEIADMLETLRNSSLESIGGIKVKEFKDYLKGEDNLIPANVLKYVLEDGSWVAIRPSGTEPKCKFYFCIEGDTMHDCEEKFNRILESIKTLTNV